MTKKQFISYLLSFLLIVSPCDQVSASGRQNNVQTLVTGRKNATTANNLPAQDSKFHLTMTGRKNVVYRFTKSRGFIGRFALKSNLRGLVVTAGAKTNSQGKGEQKPGEYELQAQLTRARTESYDAEDAPYPTLDQIFEEVQGRLLPNEGKQRKFFKKIRGVGIHSSIVDLLPTKRLSELLEEEELKSRSSSFFFAVLDSARTMLSTVWKCEPKYDRLNDLLTSNREKFFHLVTSTRYDDKEISDFFGGESKYLRKVTSQLEQLANFLSAKHDVFSQTDGKVLKLLESIYSDKNVPSEIPNDAQLRSTFEKYSEKGQRLKDARPLIEESRSPGSLLRLCSEPTGRLLYVYLQSTESEFDRKEKVVQELRKKIEKIVQESRAISNQAINELKELDLEGNLGRLKLSSPGAENAYILAIALQLYSPGLMTDEIGLLQKTADLDCTKDLNEYLSDNSFLRELYLELFSDS